MSEADRNPAIRIHIDQQVFIDAVLGNEEIEDATVVTEVVGFDRSATSYLLDGALVFSGYIRQEEDRELEITAEDLQGDIGSVMQEDEMTVQQIHCRMPFTLEVPVAAQRNEFINVVPRVGTWNLSTLGPKWVHVRAELIVNGLTGEEGYRFRCGTQEEGIPESQALAFAEGYRTADEYAAQVQEPMVGEAAHPFDPQQASPFGSQSLQFPFSPSWQKGVEGAERALDGVYPFSTPYTTPYVSSKQPPSWDRQWPDPIGTDLSADAANTDVANADAANAAVTDETIESENSAFESSVQANRGYDSVEQVDRKVDAESVEGTEPFYDGEQSTEEAFVTSTNQADVDIFESSFRQSEPQQQSEDVANFVENQPYREEVVGEQSTIDVVTVDVETDSATLEPSLQEAAEEKADTTFHFEDVAESSTLLQEPKFQLKIQGKEQKESSTFGAMSTLMEAAQADRQESSTVADSKEGNRESSSSPVSTEAIRESSSYVSAKDLQSASVGAAEQPVPVEPVTVVESGTVVEQVVGDVEAPVIVEQILEVTQPVQAELEQERPVELMTESGTEVDVKAADEPATAAAVTIAERKQQESDSSRVYLWTELYPFLEETFQPVKFRIVQEEDSVDRIAEAYRITTMDLMRANHMQTEQIDAGQLLYIPVRKR